MKPIIDKAEISIDFPDKAYIGSFGHHSVFTVAATAENVQVKLVHPGEDRRTAEIILHYFLLADIVADVAAAVEKLDGGIDDAHREPLLEAAKKLAAALHAHKTRRAHK